MAIESQGFKLEIESGTGVAKNISGITLGAITEVTSTAHGLSAGAVGAFASIVGTTQLNGQTAMVIAKEDNSLFFDIDSSGYTAYDSAGTFTPATYTEVSEITDWSGPDGQATVIDTTHLQSTYKEFLMGLPDEGQVTFTMNRDFSDAGQSACIAAREARAPIGFKMTYSDGTYQTFDAVVLSFSISGAVDDKVPASMVIKITGAVTTT